MDDLVKQNDLQNKLRYTWEIGLKSGKIDYLLTKRCIDISTYC